MNLLTDPEPVRNHFQSAIHFFFFNDTAPTEIYTLSLHDALPIWLSHLEAAWEEPSLARFYRRLASDRKSTRLNSSHVSISYAVFCLKKKNQWLSAEIAKNDKTHNHYLGDLCRDD